MHRATANRCLTATSGILLVLIILPPLIALFVPNLLPPEVPNTPPLQLAEWRIAVMLGRTVALATLAAALATCGGLALGHAIAAHRTASQPWLAGLVGMPLIIPPFINALCGVMLLEWIGLPCHGFWLATATLGLSYCPMATLLVWVGLRRRDASAREAALLGGSLWRRFLRIEMPTLRPYLWTAFVLVALLTSIEYTVPSLFRVNTYPVVVFARFAAYYDIRGAVMLAWPYVVLPALVLWTWQRTVSADLSGRKAPRPVCHATRPHVGWSVLLAFGVALTALLPVTVLVIKAGGLQTYVTAWRTAHGQLLTSFLLATVSATLLTLTGLVISVGIRAASGSVRGALEYLALLPVALPGSLFGVGLIVLWNHPPVAAVLSSMVILPILYAARFIPFAVRPQFAALCRVGSDMLDAAALSNTSQMARFRHIVLPVILPGTLAAWTICFALCFRELTGTLLVAPPGVEMLAIRIYSLYHYGAGKLVAALALFMLTTSAAVVALALAAIWISRPCSKSNI